MSNAAEVERPRLEWKVVIPASRRADVERYCDYGMLRGRLILGKITAGMFTVRCTDERDAVWLQLYMVTY